MQSLKAALHWYENNIDPKTGLFDYAYYPVTDTTSKFNNHIRQLATIWVYAETSEFLKNNSYNKLTKTYLDTYLKNKQTRGNYSYLLINKESPIALNAFLILTLLHTDYPDKNNLLTGFANGIIKMQQTNGSFQTDFIKHNPRAIDYYPGEAMLALMQLYEKFKNPLYLKAVLKAFPYYRSYWKNNKNTAFIPWQTQAYTLAYTYTQKQEFADFIFEMNDWLIDNNQITHSPYPDEIGGFPKDNPSNDTALSLEGITDAYMLAKKIKDTNHEIKYKTSILSGIRYVLQTQATYDNTYYARNKLRAVGGFYRSLNEYEQRIDMTQHAARAVMKTLQTHLLGWW